MSIERIVMVTVVVVAGLVVAGCGAGERVSKRPMPPSASAGQPARTWDEPANYAYTVDSRCGERQLVGRIALTVADGRVVRAAGLDEPGRRVASLDPARLPTLGQLLDEYESARRAGAAVAEVTFDPVDGHPTRIDIDPNPRTVDDEACYVILAYARAG